MKKASPSMDLWLKEAKSHESAPKIGMYLTHNGIVRQSAKARSVMGRRTPDPLLGWTFPTTGAKLMLSWLTLIKWTASTTSGSG